MKLQTTKHWSRHIFQWSFGAVVFFLCLTQPINKCWKWNTEIKGSKRENKISWCFGLRLMYHVSDWFTMGWRCYLLVLKTKYKLYKCVFVDVYFENKTKQNRHDSYKLQVIQLLANPKELQFLFSVRISSDIVTMIIYHRLWRRRRHTSYCAMKMNGKNEKLLSNISFPRIQIRYVLCE